VQSSSQIVTTDKSAPNFLQAGGPSCHPTNSGVRALNSVEGNNIRTTDRLNRNHHWVVAAAVAAQSKHEIKGKGSGFI